MDHSHISVPLLIYLHEGGVKGIAGIVCMFEKMPLDIVLKIILVKGKGNVDLYSASSRTPLTRSDMDHTVACKQHRICLYP